MNGEMMNEEWRETDQSILVVAFHIPVVEYSRACTEQYGFSTQDFRFNSYVSNFPPEILKVHPVKDQAYNGFRRHGPNTAVVGCSINYYYVN